MSPKTLEDSGHRIRGLNHTGVAYTRYRCVDCGEASTTPRGFSEVCDAR